MSINAAPRKKRHSFKTKSRFRLSFFNENTFNEVWTMKFSRSKVVFAVILLISSIACLITTIIAFTPVRTLLPGYLNGPERRENVLNSMRLDSLIIKNDITESYINNVRSILTDTLALAGDSAKILDFSGINTDSLLSPSENERQFISKFEEKEKFNLKVLSPLAAIGLTFFSPLDMSKPVQDSEVSPTTVTLPLYNHATITAVHSGTVIDTYYSPVSGHTVVIQHPKGFLSRYSSLASSYVRKGDKVETGAALGAGPENAKENDVIYFELWNNGTQLNPWKYIPF